MSADVRRTWRSILIGGAVSAGLIGLALAGSVVYFVVRHHDSRIVSEETAAGEFDRARRTLTAQSPLVEIRDGQDPILHRQDRTPPLADAAHTLRVLVFESRSGRLVRTNLPFRIVRLMHANGFAYLGELTFFDDTEFDGDRVHLTLDDLEWVGRGVIVDHRHADGGRFLAWVE